MKKILLAIAVAASAMAVNAQNNPSVATNGIWDNWSVGIQGGVYQPTMGQNMLKDMRAGVNIDITKQFTPIFGVGASYFAGINANNGNPTSNMFWRNERAPKTAFDFSNLSVDGIINLSNLFCGYNENRTLNVSARAGAGWGYIMGDCYPQEAGTAAHNFGTAKFGLDFDIKAGQNVSVNLKPAITYWEAGKKLDVHNSYIQLLAGVTYHFGKSNFDRSISVAELEMLKAECDARNRSLEDEMARLRDENAKLRAEIAKLNAELAAKPKEVVISKETTKLAPVVIFQLGKSTIDASQKPSVAMIATYMKNHPESKVTINGYASPEGNAELNQRLSDARAKAVYDMLVNTYKISPDRLTHKGLGVTDELFDENDWNRVAVFVEESK